MSVNRTRLKSATQNKCTLGENRRLLPSSNFHAAVRRHRVRCHPAELAARPRHRRQGRPPQPQGYDADLTRDAAGLRRSPRSFHRAVGGVTVAEVAEHLFRDFGLVFAVGALGDPNQIEVLDREMIVVEPEIAAQRFEVGLFERGAQRILVRGRAVGLPQRAVDQ